MAEAPDTGQRDHRRRATALVLACSGLLASTGRVDFGRGALVDAVRAIARKTRLLQRDRPCQRPDVLRVELADVLRRVDQIDQSDSGRGRSWCSVTRASSTAIARPPRPSLSRVFVRLSIDPTLGGSHVDPPDGIDRRARSVANSRRQGRLRDPATVPSTVSAGRRRLPPAGVTPPRATRSPACHAPPPRARRSPPPQNAHRVRRAGGRRSGPRRAGGSAHG